MITICHTLDVRSFSKLYVCNFNDVIIELIFTCMLDATVDLIRADPKCIEWKDDATGNSLLHLMAYSNMSKQTVLLLDHGADVNAKNKVFL